MIFAFSSFEPDKNLISPISEMSGMPSLPQSQDYTLETRQLPIQVGDQVLVINKLYENKCVFKGYIGRVLSISTNDIDQSSVAKVIFGTTFLKAQKEKYLRSGVILIKTTDLIRCFFQPLADLKTEGSKT